MDEENYFRRHINEYAGNEYYRFKVMVTGALSFMVIIHRKKTPVDLYEEVDLRLHGVTGTRFFRLTTDPADATSELELRGDPLDMVIPPLIGGGRIAQVQAAPQVHEIHIVHGVIYPR